MFISDIYDIWYDFKTKVYDYIHLWLITENLIVLIKIQSPELNTLDHGVLMLVSISRLINRLGLRIPHLKVFSSDHSLNCFVIPKCPIM